MKVLIVEDDPEVAETLGMAFSFRWPECEVKVADTGALAIESASKGGFDLITLDVNLPDQDGFSVLENIRQSSRVPVIMLTVRASEPEKVRGLEMGADDYLAKPFSPFELVARARAVLRRSGKVESDESNAIFEAGALKVNVDTAEVFVRDELVKLSPTEFRILSLLAQHAGKVVSRETLAKEIWGPDRADVDGYLLKLHIQHLRRKMGDSGAKPELIITVRGFGYKVPA